MPQKLNLQNLSDIILIKSELPPWQSQTRVALLQKKEKVLRSCDWCPLKFSVTRLLIDSEEEKRRASSERVNKTCPLCRIIILMVAHSN